MLKDGGIVSNQRQPYYKDIFKNKALFELFKLLWIYFRLRKILSHFGVPFLTLTKMFSSYA